MEIFTIATGRIEVTQYSWVFADEARSIYLGKVKMERFV